MADMQAPTTTTAKHIVALSYPGGGHINPLMEFCKSLVSRSDINVVVTFVVTTEWLGFITDNSNNRPTDGRIRVVPMQTALPRPVHVTQPEDFLRYLKDLIKNMKDSFEKLVLDRLDQPRPCLVIADALLTWAASVGNRINIPVVSYWTMSGATFSSFLNFRLLEQHGHFVSQLPAKSAKFYLYMEMEAPPTTTTTAKHIVALPFPGGGHNIPLMEFCKSLVSRSDINVVVTFVVTTQSLGFITRPTDPRIRVLPMQTVLPRPVEVTQPADFTRHLKDLIKNMEDSFEKLVLPRPCLIIADALLTWAAAVGNRRNIPVASYWVMSAATFSSFVNFRLLEQHGHLVSRLPDLERGKVRVDYMPGLSPTTLEDIGHSIEGFDDDIALEVSGTLLPVPTVQAILISSIYDLEQSVIDSLRSQISVPVYAIATFGNNNKDADSNGDDDYFRWLEDQPEKSVLYISLGVLAPIPPNQLEEITAGLRESRIRFLMVGRSDTDRLRQVCGERGIVVPYCDQVRVLSHKSVVGFWSHCGWNSTMEGALSGVPILATPLFGDQFLNRKYVVEDWKTGLEIRKEATKDEISQMLIRFMDPQDVEAKKMRENARKLQNLILRGNGKGKSFENEMASFVKQISSLSQENL